ncbi:MAG: PilZ domain-containing protein [Proteobacteria bacterium]|nr:MAG: PilZ domain-containing protein [Pseudomonadota bacterium]
MGTSASRKNIEMRRSPRRVFSRPIGVLCDGHYKLAQAIEISEGGIRFVSDTRFAKDERALFTIVIPGGDSVVVRGTVIREIEGPNRTFEYGCQFQSLGLHQRRAIRSYVSAKTQEEAEVEADEGGY